jgi:hypothetical protein
MLHILWHIPKLYVSMVHFLRSSYLKWLSNSPLLWELNIHYRLHELQTLGPILRQIKFTSIFPCDPLYSIRPSTPRSNKEVVSFLRVFSVQFCVPSMRSTRPANLIFLHMIFVIVVGGQYQLWRMWCFVNETQLGLLGYWLTITVAHEHKENSTLLSSQQRLPISGVYVQILTVNFIMTHLNSLE